MKCMPAVLVFFTAVTISRAEYPGKTVPVYVKPGNFGEKIVILIRHAEKITDEDPTLSDKGKARAEYLKHFFGGSATRPKIIFAQRNDEKHRSIRPIETVRPLSNAFDIPLNIDFKAKETKELAAAIRGFSMDKFPVLVCWSHKRIGKIASKLMGKDSGDFPKGYDTVWTIELEKMELAVSKQGF